MSTHVDHQPELSSPDVELTGEGETEDNKISTINGGGNTTTHKIALDNPQHTTPFNAVVGQVVDADDGRQVITAKTDDGSVVVSADVQEGEESDGAELPASTPNIVQAQEDDSHPVIYSARPTDSTSSLAEQTSASPVQPVASTTADTDNEDAFQSQSPAKDGLAKAQHDQQSGPDEATGTSTSSANASPSMLSSAAARPPIAAKKFTSSLSMNKKFLEKSGASAGANADGKSPSLATPSFSKLGGVAGLSSARSPGGTSPSSPFPPTLNASPVLAHPSATAPSGTTPSSSSSVPRLLTGKLSTLGGSGLPGSGGPGAPTWGRPGNMTSAGGGAAGAGAGASGSFFGRSSFVPAPSVDVGENSSAAREVIPPPPPRGAQLPVPGRGRGGMQMVQGRGPHNQNHFVWTAAGQQGGSGRGGARSLENEFPTFGETARAEQQRRIAMVAKQKAEEIASEAHAAYNQRVLEGLKGFSGIHDNPNAPHWDEMDDDDDLGDILEFADGTRYEVDQLPEPTAAESAAFAQAELASLEAARLHKAYEETVAAEVSGAQRTGPLQQEHDIATVDEQVRKSERFIDDYDRKARAALSGATPNGEALSSPAAAREAQSGRTLFNDRLGRFEPYAGRQPQTAGKKDLKSPPAAVLQRPLGKSLPDGINPKTQRGSSVASTGNTAQMTGQNGKNKDRQAPPPKVPADQRKPSAQAATPPTTTQPKKVESAWAKLPPITKATPFTQPQLFPQLPGSHTNAEIPTVTSASVIHRSANDQASPTVSQTVASQQSVTPAAVGPPAPTQPAEDVEAAYKAQMQENADRARKRRLEEEAEREARVERAKRKAQELEEAAKAKADAVVNPAAVSPTKILSPPLSSRTDRAASWRRTSVSQPLAAEQSTNQAQPRTLLQPVRRQSQRDAGARLVKPDETVATAMPSKSNNVESNGQTQHARKAPSTASFAALIDGFLKKSTTASPESARPSPPIEHDVARPITGSHAPLVVPQMSPSRSTGALVNGSDHRHGSVVDISEPVLLPQPFVKLGKSTPPATSSAADIADSLLQHAFPKATILVPAPMAKKESDKAARAPTMTNELSGINKIMQQVRAAQNDMEAKRLEEQQRPPPRQLDGALERISQALGEASLHNGRLRYNVARNEPIVAYVPEIFDSTALERPLSPRPWKTFAFKLSLPRKTLPAVHTRRLADFEHIRIPGEVTISTWYKPKDMRLPKSMTVDEYLHGRADPADRIVIKVSKLHLPSAPPEPELETERQSEPTSSAVKMGSKFAGGRIFENNWRRVGEDVAPAPPVSETMVALEALALEDFAASDSPFDIDDMNMTVSFDAFEDEPEVIRVALPRSVGAPTDSLASQPITSPELGRFKTYGPKLPENSTVVFRRRQPSIAPVANGDSIHTFMVNSELSDSANAVETSQAGLQGDGSAFAIGQIRQVAAAAVEDEIARALNYQASRASPIPPVVTNSQVLPSLLAKYPKNVQAISELKDNGQTAPKPPFATMRKEDLPKHVTDELERLNATVGSVPLTVGSLFDSPSSLEYRTASPWIAGGRSNVGLSSALSMAGLDPSLSVWSKPTEETAAAAAAAGQKSRDETRKNSIDGMGDDFVIPSSAQELLIADSDVAGSEGRDTASALGHQRTPSSLQHADRQRANASANYYSAAHGPSSASGSSRQGSFGISSAYPDPIPSPYTVTASLPYPAATSAYVTPAHAHAHAAYTQYAAAHSYGTSGYAVAAGTVPAGYAQVPVAITHGDARNGHTYIPGSSTVWMQTPSDYGNGQYVPAYAAYGTASHGFTSGSSASHSKGRLYSHGSPLTQHVSAPLSAGRNVPQGYPAYYSTQAAQYSTHAHSPYAAVFSPALPSPTSASSHIAASRHPVQAYPSPEHQQRRAPQHQSQLYSGQSW